MSERPSLKVKLEEPNELKFMLSIKGNVSDPKPSLRFLISEAKTGMSMCFPMVQLEGGKVSVQIPALPQVFQENTEYTGKVEVIIGNKLFNPATVGLVFEKALGVEVQPLLEEVTDFDAVIKKDEPEQELDVPMKRTILNENTVKNVLFSEPKPLPKPVTPIAEPENSLKAKMKTQLKSLISEAWAEMGEKKK